MELCNDFNENDIKLDLKLGLNNYFSINYTDFNKTDNKTNSEILRRWVRSDLDKDSHKKNKDSGYICDYSSSYSSSSSTEMEYDDLENCDNILCDHSEEFTQDELNEINDNKPIKVKNINDLIEIGKKYRCRRRTEYYGINLRILYNLILPLSELGELIGMNKVKDNIVNHIIFFLQGLNEKSKCYECKECFDDLPCLKNMNDDMLHTVITGPPGVGKTELGKILGKVYNAMGILSSGEFYVAKRSDLIGRWCGHTAMKTQDFIDKCEGGVMFIDEAYSLGNKENKDPFTKECIDTINQNLSEKRNFLCIIAGYEKELEECFFSYNPGLARRFAFRYDISGYKPDELMEIFLLKVRKDDWYTDFDDKTKLLNFFTKNTKSFSHYGGDVETLFLNCKISHSKRVLFKSVDLRKVLTMIDIERGFKLYLKNKKYRDAADSDRMMYL